LYTQSETALECERGQRAAFLASACVGDEALRREVESLIASHEQAHSFIKTPASDVAAELLAGGYARLEAGQRIGHYTITALLGAGGMGEVYLAKDDNLDRQVALKILNDKFHRDETNLHRFTREAKAASALNHPNILVIHEIGSADDAHYIVSEYVAGDTLRELLKRSALQLSELLDLSLQIASALSAAHKSHLVHRDIKPENVMVRDDGLVKVLDFGLAKLVEQKDISFLGSEDSTFRQNDTAKGIILGTVNYMSPEQAKGEPVDERTDIFSFGVVLYEMFAGRTPFQGETVSETFANLINQEPQPLSRLAANVPDELQSIVFKLLRKNKDERYQTMKDVLTDLKDVRENLSLEEKSRRFAAPGGDAIQVLQATTGDAKRSTAETRDAVSQSIRRHQPLAAFVSIGLLVGAIALGFYFYTAKDASVGDKKSIAVLPLKPINTANRDEVYEIGIADSLIHRLSLMKGFVVRPLSATRKYADINQDPIAAGREQQADYVLASNYQLAGGKIRITTQLLNVSSGQIEDTYKSEKDASDVFAMQDAVAGEFGKIMQARFATTSSSPVAKRGTTNEETYRLYLQGKNLRMKRNAADAKKAVEYFEQAIRLDPNYASAYAGLAGAYLTSGLLHSSVTSVAAEKAQEAVKVREAVKKALELDNNLAEAYAVRANLELVYEWDFAAVEKDLLHAIELEPNNDSAHWLYALLLAYRGRFAEAMAEIETAQAIDPGALMYMRDRGRILYYARRYDEAIVQLKRVIDLDENFGTAYDWLWNAYEMKGDYAGAYESFIKRRKRTNPDRTEILQRAYETAGWLGVRRKQLEFLKPDEHKPGASSFDSAAFSARLGEKEQAFAYQNKAVAKREWAMIMLNVDPTLDPLRGDPRFVELVRRVGLK